MKLYRPANGAEADGFMEQFCYRCVHDHDDYGCPIKELTFLHEKIEENYPNQWRYEEDIPLCLGFTVRR